MPFTAIPQKPLVSSNSSHQTTTTPPYSNSNSNNHNPPSATSTTNNYTTLRNKTLLFFIEKLLEISTTTNISTPPTNSGNGNKGQRTLHDLSCQFGSKGFTREMRQIAGGSQSGLKKFLLEFPSIFQIEGDLVSYKDTEKKIQEGNTENCNGKDNAEQDAVQYFRERLMQYGIGGGVLVPVRSLLGHRSQAAPQIRHICGQHIDTFTNFLSRHPETFTLNSQDALVTTVTLTEFLNSGNNGQPATPSSLLSATILQPDANANANPSGRLALLNFYTDILSTRGPMLLEQLFHAQASSMEMETFQNFIKSVADLKSFLKMHSEVFETSQNHLTTLSPSWRPALEYYKKQLTKRQEDSEEGDSGSPEQIQISIKPIPPSQPHLHTAIEPGISPGDQGPAKPVKSNPLKTRVTQILLKTITQNSQQSSNTGGSSSNGNRRNSGNVSFMDLLQNSNQDDQMLKNALLSNKTQIITSQRKAKEIVGKIVGSSSVIGMGIESLTNSDQLGALGAVSIVTLGYFLGDNDNDFVVAIFDVLAEPTLMEELKTGLFDNENVVKCFHDCRSPSASLYRNHGIVMKNVFDAQAAFSILNGEFKQVKNVGLLGVVEGVGLCGKGTLASPWMRNEQKGKDWSRRRPIAKSTLASLALDTLLLWQLHKLVEPKITAESLEIFKELTEDQLFFGINPDEIRMRRKIRKNERDLKELKDKIEGGLNRGEVLVLSNRELRLLKHLSLPPLAKEKLKSSLKIAKKLEKLEKKEQQIDGEAPANTSNNQLSSSDCPSASSSEPTSLEYFGPNAVAFNEKDFFGKVEGLLKMVDNEVAMDTDDTFSSKERVDVCTQTHSTGDVVVMRVWEE